MTDASQVEQAAAAFAGWARQTRAHVIEQGPHYGKRAAFWRDRRRYTGVVMGMAAQTAVYVWLDQPMPAPKQARGRERAPQWCAVVSLYEERLSIEE